MPTDIETPESGEVQEAGESARGEVMDEIRPRETFPVETRENPHSGDSGDAAQRSRPGIATGDEGYLTAEIKEHRQRAEFWESKCREALRDREIAIALVGQPLLPGAAAQLLKLWREEFDTYQEDGVVKVAGRDGHSVNQAVALWLAKPEYAHFCQATTRGGVATPGAARMLAADRAEPQPRTLGEAAVARWRQEARPDGGAITGSFGRRRR